MDASQPPGVQEVAFFNNQSFNYARLPASNPANTNPKSDIASAKARAIDRCETVNEACGSCSRG